MRILNIPILTTDFMKNLTNTIRFPQEFQKMDTVRGGLKIEKMNKKCGWHNLEFSTCRCPKDEHNFRIPPQAPGNFLGSRLREKGRFPTSSGILIHEEPIETIQGVLGRNAGIHKS
jgi:hypothetical protein